MKWRDETRRGMARQPSGCGVGGVGTGKSRGSVREGEGGKRNQLLFARNVVRGKWRTEGWPDVMAPSTQPRLLPSGICSVSIRASSSFPLPRPRTTIHDHRYVCWKRLLEKVGRRGGWIFSRGHLNIVYIQMRVTSLYYFPLCNFLCLV